MCGQCVAVGCVVCRGNLTNNGTVDIVRSKRYAKQKMTSGKI